MTASRCSSLLLCLGAVLLVLVAIAPQSASAQTTEWQYFTGRATEYGGPEDPWSIHDGSCGYGYLDWHKATGWAVAAMADADAGYSGSCGRCYEVACQNAAFTDGYGQTLDRSNVCYNTSTSLTIQITDSCPCNYPPNAYSNKRWCCGDMWHLDLSIWAFERLANVSWGVIELKVREVPCGYVPVNVAPAIANPTVASQQPPAGWNMNNDKRPWPAGTPSTPNV